MLLAALLLAITPADHFARGQALYASLDYEAAAEELMVAATDPRASDELRLQANLLAGIAHRVIGKDADAHLNFRYVLLRAPKTELPRDISPKVSLYFESVRQEIEAERDVERPAPAPAPAAPAPPPPPPGASPAQLGGVAALTVGGLALVAGGAGVVFAETSLADPDRAGSERSALRGVGQWSTGGALVGAALAVAGGALLALSGAP